MGNGGRVSAGVPVGGTGVDMSVGSGVSVGAAVSVGAGVAVGVNVAVDIAGGVGVDVSVGCAVKVAAIVASVVRSDAGALVQAVSKRPKTVSRSACFISASLSATAQAA